MADTLSPAPLVETIAAGDLYERTFDIAEGETVDDAAPVDISARAYRLLVLHPDTGEALTDTTSLTKNADGVTGRLRFSVPTGTYPRGRDLPRVLMETSPQAQTLITGTVRTL